MLVKTDPLNHATYCKEGYAYAAWSSDANHAGDSIKKYCAMIMMRFSAIPTQSKAWTLDEIYLRYIVICNIIIKSPMESTVLHVNLCFV